MVNWYYVVGSERVGPVGVDVLRDLFFKSEITNETYVWKKGFANWERLKDVSELKFEEPVQAPAPIPAPAPVEKTSPTIDLKKMQEKLAAEIQEVEVEEVIEEVVEEDSPEIIFNFNWNKIRENDELFFVKVGKDRKNFTGTDIYGPYSLVELKEAFKEKRVNKQSLVFAPGMGSWSKIFETPIDPEFTGLQTSSVALKEVPLLMVFDYFPIPLVTLVKKAGFKDGVLLGAGPFLEFQGKPVKATLYMGNELKIKNIIVNIEDYNKKTQVIDCKFLDLTHEAKKILLNHAV
jgi:GYF domain 2